MKPIFFYLLAGLGMLCGQDQRVFGKSNEESLSGKILRIRIGPNDLFENANLRSLDQILERAGNQQAKAVIFDLNVPGGIEFPSGELMTQIIGLKMPTLALVNQSAIGAGCLIAFSTDRIYMVPASKMGPTVVVSGSGAQIDLVREAKRESFLRPWVRLIAKKKGHRLEVIEAMFFTSDEERKIGEIVLGPGQVLNVNSREATKKLDGDPLVAVAEVADLSELLKIEELPKEHLVTVQLGK